MLWKEKGTWSNGRKISGTLWLPFFAPGGPASLGCERSSVRCDRLLDVVKGSRSSATDTVLVQRLTLNFLAFGPVPFDSPRMSPFSPLLTSSISQRSTESPSIALLQAHAYLLGRIPRFLMGPPTQGRCIVRCRRENFAGRRSSQQLSHLHSPFLPELSTQHRNPTSRA
jgi:hypothetical protein